MRADVLVQSDARLGLWEERLIRTGRQMLTAWDFTAQCPREGCSGSDAFFYQVQIRSADEPMTTFYKVFSLMGRL